MNPYFYLTIIVVVIGYFIVRRSAKAMYSDEFTFIKGAKAYDENLKRLTEEKKEENQTEESGDTDNNQTN